MGLAGLVPNHVSPLWRADAGSALRLWQFVLLVASSHQDLEWGPMLAIWLGDTRCVSAVAGCCRATRPFGSWHCRECRHHRQAILFGGDSPSSFSLCESAAGIITTLLVCRRCRRTDGVSSVGMCPTGSSPSAPVLQVLENESEGSSLEQLARARASSPRRRWKRIFAEAPRTVHIPLWSRGPGSCKMLQWMAGRPLFELASYVFVGDGGLGMAAASLACVTGDVADVIRAGRTCRGVFQAWRTWYCARCSSPFIIDAPRPSWGVQEEREPFFRVYVLGDNRDPVAEANAMFSIQLAWMSRCRDCISVIFGAPPPVCGTCPGCHVWHRHLENHQQVREAYVGVPYSFGSNRLARRQDDFTGDPYSSQPAQGEDGAAGSSSSSGAGFWWKSCALSGRTP